MTQTSNNQGDGNVVVQALGDNISIQVGRAGLVLTRRLSLRKREPSEERDAHWLNPFAKSTHLVGRDAELDELWRWLTANKPISIRVVTGRGGAGKTRLALELCDRAAEAGWHAGFALNPEIRANPAAFTIAHPTLVVIDYAAARAQMLADWLAGLAALDNPPSHPVRILLLERHAEPGLGWWQTALGSGGTDGFAIRRLLDPPEGPVPILPLEGAVFRRQLLSHVLREAGCEDPLPPPGTNLHFDQRLAELTWGGEPLFLIMAGLLAARDKISSVLALSRTDLAFQVAEREIERVRAIAKTKEVSPEFCIYMAAQATLRQGIASEALLGIIDEETKALHVSEAGDSRSIRSALREALQVTGADGLSPVQPDYGWGSVHPPGVRRRVAGSERVCAGGPASFHSEPWGSRGERRSSG